MRNPFAAPDPHQMAKLVVAGIEQMHGVKVIGWGHAIDQDGQRLAITTGNGTARYVWSPELDDWKFIPDQVVPA
jgi:hypothetical protein